MTFTLLLAACTSSDDPTPTPTATAEATPTTEATATPALPPTAEATPPPAPRDPTIAPDGRTAIRNLDAIIEVLLTGNEANLATRYGGIALRSCREGFTDQKDLALLPADWQSTLAAAQRSLYAVTISDRSPTNPTSFRVVLAVPSESDMTEGWSFEIGPTGIAALQVGCEVPPSAFTLDVSANYNHFLVLPPLEDLPVAPAAHPLDVRTGDQAIDGVLALLETADTEALLANVNYDSIECSESQGEPVRCEPSEDPGTPIDVLARGSCTDPGISRRSIVERELPRIVTVDTSLHGVAVVPGGFRIDADHSILLVNQRQTPYDWRTDALYIRDGQIVAWDVDCGARVNLLYPPLGYLVAPGADYDNPTGVAVLDQAVAAIATANLDALTAVVDWQLVGCLEPGVSLGIGQPPYCEGDEQLGDLVETLTFASCEGAPVRRETAINNLQSLIEKDWAVYTIADLGPPPVDSRFAFRYQVVLIDGSAEFAPLRSLYLSADGLRLISSGCGATDPAWVLRPGNTANFLLAPPSDG